MDVNITKKMKALKLTLRAILLSIFISLFVFIILTLTSIFYFHYSKTVLDNAILMMDNAAFNVLYALDYQLLPSKAASQFSANNIREDVLDINDKIKILTYMVHLLKGLPLANGLFWGDQAGNFVYVRKHNTGFIAEYLNKNKTPIQNELVYLDNTHHILKEMPSPKIYDPRKSTWYQLAAYKKNTTWTNAYRPLYGQYNLGTTVATPAYNANHLIGVFGIDIILDNIARFVSTQTIKKEGKIYIVNNQGLVITIPHNENYAKNKMPDVHVIDNQALATAFKMYKETGETTFEFTEEKTEYIASFKIIPILADHGWMIAIIDRADDFTGNLHRIEFFYIFITMIFFFIGLLLISNLVSRLIKPIKALVKETDQIKNFNLEDTKNIPSNIKEVFELSDAIHRMKLGLRSFQKYVPADLVRQLIKSDKESIMQGHKSDLAIFFSDIKDFSTITEKDNSAELVVQICDYFDIIAHHISENEGTIDKYIGDSIMAFWGAPLKVQDPCQKGAIAALKSINDLTLANKKWDEIHKPQLLTRIALHYGEAVVGSLGSSERLNYTAIGDAINLTNRLVNINKVYGTSIIVTGSFYQAIKDQFALRFIDNIKVKGKIECVAIYELLAENSNDLTFDLKAYQEKYQLAFSAYQQKNWQQAISLFEQCLLIYPEDSLALTFIQRAKSLLRTPPEEWDGIWSFKEK